MKAYKEIISIITAASFSILLAAAASVSAASTYGKSGSTLINYNGSANEHIYYTESGHTSNLTAQYYYGSSSSGKADMICTYGYSDVVGYKYAAIKNNNVTYGNDNIDGKTDVSVVQRSITNSTSSNTSVIYSGYVKTTMYSSTKLHFMNYYINLN